MRRKKESKLDSFVKAAQQSQAGKLRDQLIMEQQAHEQTQRELELTQKELKFQQRQTQLHEKRQKKQEDGLKKAQQARKKKAVKKNGGTR